MKFDDLYNVVTEKTAVDAGTDKSTRNDPKGPFKQKVEPAGPQGFKGPSDKVKDAARDASIKPRFSVKTPSREQMKASKDRFLRHKKAGFPDAPSLKDRLDKLTLPEKTIKENIKAASKGLKALGARLKGMQKGPNDPSNIVDLGKQSPTNVPALRRNARNPSRVEKMTQQTAAQIAGERGKPAREIYRKAQTHGISKVHPSDRARIAELLKEYKKYK